MNEEDGMIKIIKKISWFTFYLSWFERSKNIYHWLLFFKNIWWLVNLLGSHNNNTVHNDTDAFIYEWVKDSN